MKLMKNTLLTISNIIEIAITIFEIRVMPCQYHGDAPSIQGVWNYRPIPFDDILTPLVSIFLLLRDERKGRESAPLT